MKRLATVFFKQNFNDSILQNVQIQHLIKTQNITKKMILHNAFTTQLVAVTTQAVLLNQLQTGLAELLCNRRSGNTKQFGRQRPSLL